jgi:hypothetical protein
MSPYSAHMSPRKEIYELAGFNILVITDARTGNPKRLEFLHPEKFPDM